MLRPAITGNMPECSSNQIPRGANAGALHGGTIDDAAADMSTGAVEEEYMTNDFVADATAGIAATAGTDTILLAGVMLATSPAATFSAPTRGITLLVSLGGRSAP